MKTAPQLPDENERLKTLQSLNVLDTPSEERFDRITQLASKIFQVPIALVSLIDANRQWFKSSEGLSACETGRDISFCGHAIEHDDIFIIENAIEDYRFFDNPLVTGEPHIRFYAGCPLIHPNGHRLGTLCLIDQKPRTLTPALHKALSDLAALAQLELVEQNVIQLDKETGFHNQSSFMQMGEIILPTCNELRLPVSIAALQLSHLESEQDTPHYNSALSIIVDAFNSEFRSSDIVGRYDPNNFFALVTNSNKTNTTKKINKVRTLITDHPHFPFAEIVTVTTAVTESNPTVTFEQLVGEIIDTINR